jgi:hypothetical protein
VLCDWSLPRETPALEARLAEQGLEPPI